MLKLFLLNVFISYQTNDISFFLYNVGGSKAFRCYYDVFIGFGYSVYFYRGNDKNYNPLYSRYYGYYFNEKDNIHIKIKGERIKMNEDYVNYYKSSESDNEYIMICFYKSKSKNRKTICNLIKKSD